MDNQIRIVNTYFIITQYLDQYKEHAKEYDVLKEQTPAMFTAFNNRDWGAVGLLADSIKRIMKKYHLPK